MWSEERENTILLPEFIIAYSSDMHVNPTYLIEVFKSLSISGNEM